MYSACQKSYLQPMNRYIECAISPVANLDQVHLAAVVGRIPPTHARQLHHAAARIGREDKESAVVAVNSQVQAGKVNPIVTWTAADPSAWCKPRCLRVEPVAFTAGPNATPQPGEPMRWVASWDSARSRRSPRARAVQDRHVPAVDLPGDIPPLLLPASNLAGIGRHDDQRVGSCRRCPAKFA